jgi:hypothetical protein
MQEEHHHQQRQLLGIVTILEQFFLGIWLLLSSCYKCMGVLFRWVDGQVGRRLEYLLVVEEEGIDVPVPALPVLESAPGEASHVRGLDMDNFPHKSPIKVRSWGPVPDFSLCEDCYRPPSLSSTHVLRKFYAVRRGHSPRIYCTWLDWST